MTDINDGLSLPLPGVYAGAGLLLLTAVVTASMAFTTRQGRRSCCRSCCFFGRLNAYLTVLVMNAGVVIACAVNVAIWTGNNQHALGVQRFLTYRLSDVIFGSCIALGAEALIVAIVSAASVRCVGPFDVSYAATAKKHHECMSKGVQVITLLAVVIGWAARVPLFQMLFPLPHQEETRGYNTMVPVQVKIQIWIVGFAGALEACMVLLWCVWHTLWRRVDYDNYTCPLCEGAKCDACYDGSVYLNP